MTQSDPAPRQAPAFVPADARMEMPEQSLWDGGSRETPPTAPRSIAARRLFLFAGTIALTVFAANEMYDVLRVAGLTVLEVIILVLFVMLFAWIAFSFVSSTIGFVLAFRSGPDPLGIDPQAPLPAVTARNALLLPTYNEEPHRVFSRLRAIYESLLATGQIDHFDVFILSDTTDPDIWIQEEAHYITLIGVVGSGRIFYRHRLKNTARKAGNIADWVTRFGAGYDHVIVLDADSLMTGDTIVRLAKAMEDHPGVGLIQTLPVLVNAQTPFARLQQFAGRLYGPLIAHGIAWWHGSEGNYWGHNAIIRVKAFAAQAGLPTLPGPRPFGGHILSHDFVEAGLMRRAGWAVHMASRLPGSYEEAPPSMLDCAIRDRRWFQGNIQHIGVLPARGLHWVSRLHLLVGIGSYITSPMWLLFLLTGILVSLQSQFVRPEYFSERSLFPQWPAQDPLRAQWVFAGTMLILVLSKILGYLAAQRMPRSRNAHVGQPKPFAGLVLETFISGLIAPVMMIMQSQALLSIALGRDSGWAPQRRDGERLPLATLARAFAWPTILGVVLGASAYAVSLSLFLWMTPVIVGLALTVPLAALTSNQTLGNRLIASGLLITPEDIEPPDVLVRANALAAVGKPGTDEEAVALLAGSAELRDAHARMLGQTARQRGDYDTARLIGTAKVADSRSRSEALRLLTPAEKFAVLSDGAALDALLGKPD